MQLGSSPPAAASYLRAPRAGEAAGPSERANACPRKRGLHAARLPLTQSAAFARLDSRPHVRQDLTEHDTKLPLDGGIREVVEAVLADERAEAAAAFRAPASPAHAQSLRTLDLPAIFELSHEYVTYARARSACERAVERLPNRQRQVVQGYYFEAMTQTELAARQGLAHSTIRNTHSGALRNLCRDDELFDVLEAVGKVRDCARRLELEAQRRAA